MNWPSEARRCTMCCWTCTVGRTTEKSLTKYYKKWRMTMSVWMRWRLGHLLPCLPGEAMRRRWMRWWNFSSNTRAKSHPFSTPCWPPHCTGWGIWMGWTTPGRTYSRQSFSPVRRCIISFWPCTADSMTWTRCRVYSIVWWNRYHPTRSPPPPCWTS